MKGGTFAACIAVWQSSMSIVVNVCDGPMSFVFLTAIGGALCAFFAVEFKRIEDGRES